MKIVIPPVRRFWAVCPRCRKNALLFDDRAECRGVYLKCKACGKEFELIVKNGRQITKKGE